MALDNIPDQGTRSIFRFIISIFKPLMTHLCQPGISWVSDWVRATQTCTSKVSSHCRHPQYALAQRQSSCDTTKVLVSMAACCICACYWCPFHNIFWETTNTITWQQGHPPQAQITVIPTAVYWLCHIYCCCVQSHWIMLCGSTTDSCLLPLSFFGCQVQR